MNIVFIGMPGCGKTTIAQLVAERLGRPWFDSDALIAERTGVTVPEIFSRYGEKRFRELETECLQELLNHSGAVISVGGGAPVYNADLLRRSATVIYLERSLAEIAKTLEPGTRPLADSLAALQQLFSARQMVYETLCDHTIRNDASIEDAVNRTMEVLK